MSLHADAWQHVLSFLTTIEVARLGAVGNPTLTALLPRMIESANFQVPSGFINLDTCNRWASRYPKIHSITVKGSCDNNTAAKWPMDFKLFPPQLASLDLCFELCIEVFLLSVDMAAVLPNLTSLSLAGAGAYGHFQKPIPLKAVKFPPRLERLFISGTHQSVIDIEAGDISRLPRTLKELSMHNFKSAENSIAYGDFMPHLTSLDIKGSVYLPYESIPHTITDLKLNVYGRCMGADSDAFPWRSYFPRLTALRLSSNFEDTALDYLLDPKAIEKPELQSLRDLIFGDAARSQAYADALKDPKSGVPHFEKYKLLHFDYTYGVTPVLREELIPLLSDLEDINIEGASGSLAEHMPNATSMYFGEASNSPVTKLPSSLTSLTGLNNDTLLDFSVLPTGLKTLDTVLNTGHATLVFFPPTSLTCLTITSITADDINILPTTITSLTTSFPALPAKPKVIMRPDLSSCLAPNDEARLNPEEWMTPCDKAWRAIASRFVNLRKLQILSSPGGPSMGLVPLKSTVFEDFSIKQQGTLTMIPWLSVVLDDMNTAGRPKIFPPSIQTMHFSFRNAEDVPFSILALLPRSLTSLTTNHMSIKTTLPNSPLPSDITPTEIMKQLPPNLKKFIWSGTMTSYGTTVFVDQSVIPCLPRSLEIFNTSLFEFVLEGGPTWNQDDEAHVMKVVELLPSNLSSFSYGPLNSYDHYYAELPKNSLLNHKITFQMPNNALKKQEIKR